MNQSIKYAPNGYYDINAGNIRTVDGNTVEIDHDLILGSLPLDVTNPDIITSDNLGRLYRLPKASLPTGNPFDQDLNTTDDVEFGNVAPVIIEPVDNALKLFGNNPLNTYKAGEIRPAISLSSDNNAGSPSINLNCYLNDFGTTKMSKTRGFKISQTATDTFFTATGGLVGGNNIGPIHMSFRFNNYTEFYLRVRLGPGIFANTVSNDFICALSGSANECVKLPRENLFLQDLLPSSSVEFADITLSNILQDDLQNKLLVLDSVSNKIEYRNVSSLPVVSPFDQNLNTTDSVEFGNVAPIITSPVNSTLKIYGDCAINTYKEGEVHPRVSLNNSNSFNNPTINLNCYVDDNGDTIMSKTRGFQILQTITDTWLTATGGVAGDINTGNLLMNFSYNDSVQFFQKVKLGTNIPTSTISNDFICTLINSDNECVNLPRENLFEQDLLPSSSVEFADITLSNILQDDLQNKLLVLDSVSNKIEYRNVSSLPTGNPFNQNLNTTDNVTFNNVFVDNLLQVDQILENTLNAGVGIGSWSFKTQKVKSDALVSAINPLSLELKFNADNEVPLSLIASDHDDMSIAFDVQHVDGFNSDTYLSGSVLSNILINKSNSSLDFLIQNGIAKGSSVLKSGMNKVLSLFKTSIELNEVCTFAQGIVANALTTDPEVQADTVLITQSSVNNEIYKRTYEAVYCSCVNTNNPSTALLLNVWTAPVLTYAMTINKNCLTVADSVVIDAGISSHLSSISYDISCASFDNQTVSYQSAIRVNGNIVTNSICNFTIDTIDLVLNVANTSIFTLNASDDIVLVVRNTLDNKPLTITKMAITINKVFQ